MHRLRTQMALIELGNVYRASSQSMPMSEPPLPPHQEVDVVEEGVAAIPKPD